MDSPYTEIGLCVDLRASTRPLLILRGSSRRLRYLDLFAVFYTVAGTLGRDTRSPVSFHSPRQPGSTIGKLELQGLLAHHGINNAYFFLVPKISSFQRSKG
ncbi:hypothetical protein NPIL_70941 [Nephila pilipes]|uniref:Uncharacterized protein n=1 Tax=Nephila pilipes TaxID=299642 RepID=A0A8X6NB35_NEPPI|nr:hypothetical protein NPIL_70941 [Nephila pilipes]